MVMKRSTAARASLFSLGAFALALGLTLTPAPVHSMGATGADTVRTLYDTLLTTMRAGPSLGASGRYARIAPIVRQVFDVPYMTQLAVGPQYTGLDAAQRQQVEQAFERYIAAVYAERFDSYAGERLQVVSEQPTSAGVMITSQIVKSNGEPVQINYLTRQSGGGWQIADVYLNGTISELATRRSEFSGILRAQGINGLIAALNQKAATLSRSG
jgi:phospholipid transport system substrate-binding protein